MTYTRLFVEQSQSSKENLEEMMEYQARLYFGDEADIRILGVIDVDVDGTDWHGKAIYTDEPDDEGD